MENIETNVVLLLNGKDAEELQDFCDFSLKDQNEAFSLKPSESPDLVPILGQSVCYVVMAVIINEKNEVLVIQEAKSSCAGKWNLPAGKIEPNESIMDAFKREVLEETGFIAEPTTLLFVESAAGFWYRFVFAGNVTGGCIKTLSQADSESLQAKWVQNLSELNLRVNNIVSIVEHARNFKNNFHTQKFHPFLLPFPRPYSKLYLRLIICARRKNNNRVHVLTSENMVVTHLPVCEMHPGRSLHEVPKRFMTKVFETDLLFYRLHGILALGHHNQQYPKIADGFCLTLLISLQHSVEELKLIENYSWFQVNLENEENLLARMGKNRTVGIRSIRIHTLY